MPTESVMSHKEEQAEFRRLKAERKARIEREHVEREAKKEMLRQMFRVYISHDEMMDIVMQRGHEIDEILSVETTEGGWKLVCLHRKKLDA